jgi:hypothetical protein
VHRDLGKNYQVLYRQEYDRYFGILEKNDRMKEEA